MLRPALMVVFLAGALAGQTPEWRSLLDQAAEADDYADYKTAEALFTQACEQAQHFDSTEGQVEACGGLARVQAIDNNLGKARKTLRELVGRIELTADPHSYSYAQALLSLADAEAALGAFDDVIARIRQLDEALPDLDPVQKSTTFADIAELYLAIGNETAGDTALRSAIAFLKDGWKPDNARYVKVANRLVRSGFFSGRPQTATDLLREAVSVAQDRMASADPPDQALVAEWVDAASQVSRFADSEAEADRLRKLVARWWKNAKLSQFIDHPGHPSSDEIFLIEQGVVTGPSLLRKRNPTYTSGGLSAGATGTVNLRAEIWPDGKAHHIQVLRPLSYGLTWRAISAVRQWRFKPSLKNGKPVKASVTMEVNFRRD